MERGHPVRLSAKREQPVDENTMRLSVLRTLADRDVRAPSRLQVRHARKRQPASES
jgi:hypothetical protein